MNPQTSQDTGYNLPEPGATTATMPLPGQTADASTSGISGGFDAASASVSSIAPIATHPMGRQVGRQDASVSAQAPSLALASPVTTDTPTGVSDTSLDMSKSDNLVLSSTIASLPAEAADTDVIEKEWVVKAKQVVSETRGDPYKQVRELNKLRADYMKKRYNKDIKLPDA